MLDLSTAGYSVRPGPPAGGDCISAVAWGRLSRWLAVHVVLESSLRQCFEEKRLTNWGQIAEALRYIANPESKGGQLLAQLNRIDFTLRDMYFSGMGRIDLNLRSVLDHFRIDGDTVINGAPEYSLVDSALRMLEERVYLDPGRMILENAREEALYALLSDGKLTLASLLRMDDEGLLDVLRDEGPREWSRLEQGVEVLFRGQVQVKSHELLAQDDLLAFGGPVSRSVKFGVVLRLDRQMSSERSYALLGLFASARRLRNVVETAGHLLADPGMPRGYERFCQAVLTALFGCRVELDFDRYKPLLEKALGSEPSPELMQDLLGLFGKQGEPSEQARFWMSLNFGDYRMTFDDPERVQRVFGIINLLGRNPGVGLLEAIRSVHPRYSMTLYPLLQKRLSASSEGEQLLEFDAFVGKLLYQLVKTEGQGPVCVAPAVRLLDADGDTTREIDLVSVNTEHEDHVQVELFEVSANTGEMKGLQDALKLAELASVIERRFDDVQVARYVVGPRLRTTFASDVRTLFESLKAAANPSGLPQGGEAL